MPKGSEPKAFQDYYPDDVNHCYGCGQLNTKGLRIRSFWDGEETVCRYQPRPEHTAIPGYVYGGLIASLIDCHGTGTAAAASYRFEKREMDTQPALRFVTAKLTVEYLRPTPLDATLEIRGRVLEVTAKKVLMAITLSARNEICARGEVLAVRMPEHLVRE